VISALTLNTLSNAICPCQLCKCTRIPHRAAGLAISAQRGPGGDCCELRALLVVLLSPLAGCHQTHRTHRLRALGLGAKSGITFSFSRAYGSETHLMGLNTMVAPGSQLRASVSLWRNVPDRELQSLVSLSARTRVTGSEPKTCARPWTPRPDASNRARQSSGHRPPPPIPRSRRPRSRIRSATRRGRWAAP
jgi:hypothetical protein